VPALVNALAGPPDDPASLRGAQFEVAIGPAGGCGVGCGIFLITAPVAERQIVVLENASTALRGTRTATTFSTGRVVTVAAV
jgi:hypothetical protein